MLDLEAKEEEEMTEARMPEDKLIAMFNQEVKWNMEECRVLGVDLKRSPY